MPFTPNCLAFFNFSTLEKDWKIELAAIILVVLLFNFVAKKVLKALESSFKKQKRFWSENFVSALYLPLSYYVWFFALVHAINLVGHTLLKLDLGSSLNDWLKIGAVLATAWFLLRWKNNSVETLRSQSRKKEIVLEQGKIDVINKLGTIVIFFITILTLLEVTHRSINTLIAFGGVGGLALAIASQEVVANFFGGLMIYITHPFGVGDTISLQEKNIEGKVEDIGWYMTRIRNPDKKPVYIPNSVFSKAVVITPSRMSHHRFKEVFGIRYSDMSKLKAIMSEIKEMLKQDSHIDKDQSIKAYLKAFGAHSVDMEVICFSKKEDDDDFNSIRQDLLIKTYDIILKNGAEIASPITYVEMTDKK